jgi:hypothetical protein
MVFSMLTENVKNKAEFVRLLKYPALALGHGIWIFITNCIAIWYLHKCGVIPNWPSALATMFGMGSLAPGTTSYPFAKSLTRMGMLDLGNKIFSLFLIALVIGKSLGGRVPTREIICKVLKMPIVLALDVEAVKKMVRKDTIHPLGLIKHALAVLFEFKGRGNYHDYQFFNQTVNGYFLTENYNYTQHREWDGIESDKIDMISYNIDRHNDVVSNTRPTYRDRIERKERLALRLLRFLLKQGCNPNDKTFIKNLVLKHNYHSKIFFIKILEMCYKYGLDENILLNILTD